MVGQVDSVEIRVVSDQLCSGQDMLPERIIKIIVFIGDVQRMTGQVAQRNDLVAPLQQQFRNAHIQNGIGNAVVSGDEYQHFIVRSQGRQQSFALFFHGGGMAAHRHGTTEQSFGTKRFRDSQDLAQSQHCRCHSFLPKIEIEYRTEQSDALALNVQSFGNGCGCRLHIDTAVVVFHTALFVLHRVDSGQEDIIYFLVDELLHMAVNKFDRVAGLPLCGLLSQPDRFLAGRVGQDDIEAQRGKEGIRHREELVDHQRKRHTYGLFTWVTFASVTLQKQFVRLLIEVNILLNLRTAAVLCVLRRAVKSHKSAGCIAHSFMCQQSRAIRTTDGKDRADLYAVTVCGLECRHNAGVVIDTAMQNDVLSHRFRTNNFM